MLPEIECRLGHDLAALVRRIDAPLQEAKPITVNPSRHSRRACFQLRFADGRSLKGRRFDSAQQAQRVRMISQLLRGRPFSSVVAHEGCALLEEWIDGQSMEIGPLSPDRIRQAGVILGGLSTIQGNEALFGPRLRSGSLRSERVQGQLDRIAAHGVISHKTSQRLSAIARSNCPKTLDSGLVHLDFCPENMVIDRQGAIQLVDNELMQCAPYDTDLARTWQRWLMTESEQAVFLAGYETHRSADSFIAHGRFWALFAIAGSLLYRLEAKLPTMNLAQRLRALADDAARWI